MTMTRLWTLIGVLAVVIILAAGYAVGVGPAYSAAGESDRQLADVEIQNQVKAAELARLKALDEDSASLFAELEDLQRAIPAVHDTSVFAAQAATLAAKADVTLLGVSYLSAEEALAPEADVAPVTPAEGDEGEAEAEASTAAEADATGTTQSVASVPGLIAVAVSLRLEGDPVALHKFLESTQTGLRVFTLSSVILDPATSTGDFEMKVDGFVYVLPGTDVSTLNVDAGADGTTVG
ncbi:hypothetical protein I6E52_06220 [Salinibacterium sp. NG253]|uniref:hypothetical protein n=1 Tax=Salinibacterium sp. NG253 TaxID=2792039 RepID=UPI0018CD04FE|nr:hypothetical protein [Salinibacterium sp. NG253]MBH0116438.1 hypothetical protein [Salinibacterium sp. NG253]